MASSSGHRVFNSKKATHTGAFLETKDSTGTWKSFHINKAPNILLSLMNLKEKFVRREEKYEG